VSVYDRSRLAAELFRIRTVVFTRILLNMGLYVAAMVFAAAPSQLVPRAERGV
jgi:hypothetical protein